MDRDDLLWLAGLVEGEGCFLPGPTDRPNKCTITVVMTDEDVVHRVATLFGTRPWATKTKQKPHHKQSYVARVSGHTAKGLMLELRPLMGSRRRAQIDRAIKDVSLVRHRLLEEDRVRMQEMYDQGISVPDISTRTGRSRSTIYKSIKTHSR